MQYVKMMVRKNRSLYRLFECLRKRFSFIAGHYSDYRLNIKYAMSGAQAHWGYRYRVLMLSHFLEKGMNYAKLRPFGQRHISSMLQAMELFRQNERDSFEYKVGISALSKWCETFELQGWFEEPLLPRVKFFLDKQPHSEVPVGVINQSALTPKSCGLIDPAVRDGCCILGRHSVRDFSDEPLTKDDLAFALSCFRATPIACNRQMCSIYQIENTEKKDLLNGIVRGIGGLNTDTLHYFLVTYDVAAISGAKERNQGFLNAGLAAMNFVNGLHCSGLGSCLLQWDANTKRENEANHALGLPSSARVAVVIAAGHLKEEYSVPCSARRPIEEMFKVLV